MAVDVSLQDVRDKFAEFDAISDANVNGSIVSAKLITSLTDDIRCIARRISSRSSQKNRGS